MAYLRRDYEERLPKDVNLSRHSGLEIHLSHDKLFVLERRLFSLKRRGAGLSVPVGRWRSTYMYSRGHSYPQKATLE